MKEIQFRMQPQSSKIMKEKKNEILKNVLCIQLKYE